MKKIIIKIILSVFFLLLMFGQNLFADEIRLKSGIIIKAKILRVTADYIEYDPEGSKSFDMISRDQAEKIIYEDGSVINLNNKPSNEEKIIESSEPNEEDVVIEMDRKPENKKGTTSASDQNMYIEFESGWNGYVGGLGARFDYRILNSFTINAGVGLGFWGYRLSAGTRYFLFDYPFGLAFGLGVAYNTGMEDFELDATFRDNSTGDTYEDKLIFDFKPVTVINITLLYAFRIGQRHKLYLEAGYGIPLSDDNYSYMSKDSSQNVELDQETKDDMEILQPGGVIISIGFALAI